MKNFNEELASLVGRCDELVRWQSITYDDLKNRIKDEEEFKKILDKIIEVQKPLCDILDYLNRHY